MSQQRSTKPPRSFTQEDIATRVGVSRATVSSVINNTRYVSPEVRERVLQAIQELDYVPDLVARSMKTAMTMTVGLGLSSLASPFSGRLALGVQDFIQRAGWATIIYYTQEHPGAVREGLRRLQEKRVDGVIIAPAANSQEDIADYIRRTGKPVVLVDRHFDTGLPVDEVRSDARHGSDSAVTHLLEQGRRRIAIVNMPESLSSTRDRLQGYLDAHERLGIPVDSALIRPTGFLESEGYAVAAGLLRQSGPTRPDAFFVCTHLLTIGVLTAIREAGLQIPRDIAVIGFDDMPWAPLMDPPLSVVTQQPYELGAEAARLLIARLTGQTDGFRRVRFDTRLIHRASCCSGGER